MANRFFKITAKCGHVGRGKCIWITFVTMAESSKEAAKKAREFKRVKHHHKDAIGSVKEISFDEFITIKAENDADPYLHCKNVQEQRKIPGFEARVVDDKCELRAKRKTDKSFRRKLVEIATREADSVIKRFLKVGEYA